MKQVVVPALLTLGLVLAGCGSTDNASEENLPTPIATFTPGTLADRVSLATPTVLSPTDTPVAPTATEERAEAPTETPTEAPTPTTETANRDAGADEPDTASTTGAITSTQTITVTEEATSTTDMAAATAISDTETSVEPAEIETNEPITMSEIISPTTPLTSITTTGELTVQGEISTSVVLTTTGQVTGTEATTATQESGDAAAIAEINVIMRDLYFGEENNNMTDPPVWSVPAGTEVSLTMDNQGSVQHNWAIVKLGEEVPVPFLEAENADIILYDPGLQDAGTVVTTTFTAPSEVGEYTVICTAPGHYPIMQGRLEVN